MLQIGDNRFEFQGAQSLFPGVDSGNLLDLKSVRDRVKGLGWLRMPQVNPSVFYLIDPNSKKVISNVQNTVELWTSPTGIDLLEKPQRLNKVEPVNSQDDSGFEEFSMQKVHGKFYKLCKTALGKLSGQ